MAMPDMWLALTAEVLRGRVEAMKDVLRAQGADPEHQLFQHLDCNGCGRTIDTTAESSRGWACRHNHMTGWLDICDRCVDELRTIT